MMPSGVAGFLDAFAPDAGAGAAPSGELASAPASAQRGDKRRRTGALLSRHGLAADAWKRFTPAEVDRSKCYGRTWSSGKGGQCPRKPVGTGALCAMHAKQEASLQGLAHGRVTGSIPRGKMLEFLREERRSDERALRKNVDDEHVRRGGASRLRKGKKFFARYRLWAEATKLDSEDRRVHNLTDLTVEELHRCVDRVHEYFRMNPRLQARTGAKSMGFVKPGQGPEPRADPDRHGADESVQGDGRGEDVADHRLRDPARRRDDPRR